MNYMEQAVNILGVDFKEEFYLKRSSTSSIIIDSGGTKRRYRFTKENLETFDATWRCSNLNLSDILNGTLEIVKPSFKPQFGEKYYYPFIAENRILQVSNAFWKGSFIDILALRADIVYRTYRECREHLLDDYERIMGKEWKK